MRPAQQVPGPLRQTAARRSELTKGHYTSSSRASGTWIVDGSATGLALADLLLGRVTSVEHGRQQDLPVHSWYLGLYAQDT